MHQTRPVFSDQRIAVIGLGKLGLAMAAVFADAGCSVTGVDVNEHLVAQLQRGKVASREPSVAELVHRAGDRLTFTTDLASAVGETQACFVIVPTPSDEGDGFSNAVLLEALGTIGAALRDRDDYYRVVVSSTVMPGAFDAILRPALEAASGKRCGTDFGLAYNPEFVALGDVVHGLRNPDFVLIGEYCTGDGAADGDFLEAFHAGICHRSPAIARMTPLNAEIAKLAVNCFITTKITFANQLGEICAGLPGSDAATVAAALGLDARIGPACLSPGPGFGGPCFPRDNAAFAHAARAAGSRARLAETVHALNRERPQTLAREIKALAAGSDVAILGLAYKAGTPVVEESQSIEIARLLAADGVRVSVYDPAAMDGARAVLGQRVRYAESAAACADGCGVLVIATAEETFAEIPRETLARVPEILDWWGVLDRRRDLRGYGAAAFR